jgi:hypothetical protein
MKPSVVRRQWPVEKKEFMPNLLEQNTADISRFG